MQTETGDFIVVVLIAFVIILLAVATVNYFLFYTGIGIGLLGVIGIVLQK